MLFNAKPIGYIVFQFPIYAFRFFDKDQSRRPPPSAKKHNGQNMHKKLLYENATSVSISVQQDTFRQKAILTVWSSQTASKLLVFKIYLRDSSRNIVSKLSERQKYCQCELTQLNPSVFIGG